VILGAAVLLIAVVAVLVARKASGKKEKTVEASVVISQPSVEAVPEVIMQPRPEKPRPEKPAGKELHYLVYLTDIPYGHNKYSYRVKENQAVTFGRNARSQHIVNPKDANLSAIHFSLHLQKEKFCVQDEGSRNGTFLNGVPISGKGWTKLRSGDKIRAGGYEYRIVIEPENH